MRIAVLWCVAVGLAQTPATAPPSGQKASPGVSSVQEAPAGTATPAAPATPATSPGEQQRAAMAKQIESIQKQSGLLGLRLVLWSNAPPIPLGAPDCDPLDEKVVAPLLGDAAKAQSVDPQLLRAVAEQESGLRPCAVSAKGAEGVMQIMPETGARLGVRDIFDPKENIAAGARYLKELLDKYGGDLPKALGAYNAGPSAVEQAGGVPDIVETRDYVNAILDKLKKRSGDPPAR